MADNEGMGIIETIGKGLTASIEGAKGLAEKLVLPKSKSGMIKRLVIGALIVIAVLWVIGKMGEKKDANE